MDLIRLFILFILCLLLPYLFSFLEGMVDREYVYSTDIPDKDVKYTTTPEERELIEKKLKKLGEYKHNP